MLASFTLRDLAIAGHTMAGQDHNVMVYQGVRLRVQFGLSVFLTLAAGCGGKFADEGSPQDTVNGGAVSKTTGAGAGAVSTGGAPASGGKVAASGSTSIGGAITSGGATASGGKTAATGGATASGGKTAAGGSTSLGGTSSSGGKSSSGGTVAIGGSSSFTSLGGALNDFCSGTQSKVQFGTQKQLADAPATSYISNLILDCCMADGINLHTKSTLGFDLAVETLWSVGSSGVSTGVFPLGTTSMQPMRAMVRTSTDSVSSAGVSADGTATLFSPFSYQDPFDLGLCLQLNRTETLLYGTLIYVPKVTIVPPSSSKRFQIFLLSDSTLRPDQVSGIPLDSLVLAQYPLLDLGSIAYVEESTDVIGLNPGAKIGDSLRTKLTSLSIIAVPFVVLADGVRKFLGTFVSDVASATYPGPTIMIGTIQTDAMSLRHLDSPTDPLKDARIVSALTTTGKLVP